jgi:Na+/proline symporter
MGFKYETTRRRDKNVPKRASGIGMILVFICIAAAVVIGWWVPLNVPLRAYVPIPENWYNPVVPGVHILWIQVVVGVAAFILLQFLVVLLSGIIFPPPPEELYDKDGLYIGKSQK